MPDPDEVTGARRAQRLLVQRMLDYAQTDASNLARLASVAHTTLTRFLNKQSRHLLSTRTMIKILHASGLPEAESAPLLRLAIPGYKLVGPVAPGHVVEQVLGLPTPEPREPLPTPVLSVVALSNGRVRIKLDVELPGREGIALAQQLYAMQGLMSDD